MSTGWIIFLTILVFGQFIINFTLFLMIVGVVRKIDVHWHAVEQIARTADSNFNKTGTFITEVSKFLVKAFGLDTPKMQDIDKVTPPDTNFKN